MGRYATDTGSGDFTPAPAGTHIARCIRIIDIGTHHGEYQGQPNVRNQVIVMWELPNETIEIDGQQKPILVSKFYTNSLSEKANLRRDLEAWRSRPFTAEELLKFDLMAILDKPCMLSVIHEDKNGKTKAKVSSVSAPMKGMACPAAFNAPYAFWIDEFDQEKFDALSDGLKKLVMDSDEYKAMQHDSTPKSRDTVADEFDDDIPF
jgi:hypothetical protein